MRKIKDDYGWEISATKAMDALDELIEQMGEKEVLRQLAQALTADELADCLAFICRQNDIEIEQLDNYSIKDAGEPLQPLTTSDRETMAGQGHPASLGIKYKGFRIVPVKEGWIDIYDQNMWNIYGTGYATPQEAKRAIEAFIKEYGYPRAASFDDPEIDPERVEEGATVTKEWQKNAGGYSIIKYSDGTYQGHIGGKGASRDWDSEKTSDLVSIFEELIRRGTLQEKDILRKNTNKIHKDLVDLIYDLWVDAYYPIDPLEEDDIIPVPEDKGLEVVKISEDDEEF